MVHVSSVEGDFGGWVGEGVKVFKGKALLCNRVSFSYLASEL